MRYSLGAVIIILLLDSCQEESFPVYKVQLAKDIEIIDNYLSKNQIDVIKDSTGLRYLATHVGSIFKPVLADSIQVNYSLKLLTGQSIQVNSKRTFLLSKLIKAWRTAMPLFGEGARITLYVPSGLAYGIYPSGTIPANANLIFEIELVKVIREYSAQLERDKIDVDSYLTSNNITALKDGAGVRYVITTIGPTNALTPVAADSVVVKYTAKILANGIIFDQALVPTGYLLNKSTTLKAWKSAFLLFKEGTKATLYIPSGLGYGAYGTTSVAPYANLIYDIELVKVIRK